MNGFSLTKDIEFESWIYNYIKYLKNIIYFFRREIICYSITHNLYKNFQ